MSWHSWDKRLEWLDKETDTAQREKHEEEENYELAKGNWVRIKKMDYGH